MLHDFEEVNSILAELAADGTLEPMAEPCDETDVHPLDWADATGLWDDVVEMLYPGA